MLCFDSSGLLMDTASPDTVCLDGLSLKLAIHKYEKESKMLLESVSTSILLATQVVGGKFKAVSTSFVCRSCRKSSVRRLLS